MGGRLSLSHPLLPLLTLPLPVSVCALGGVVWPVVVVCGLCLDRACSLPASPAVLPRPAQAKGPVVGAAVGGTGAVWHRLRTHPRTAHTTTP